jgi:tetratricopeptide (TPR) repeat protein
MQRATGGNLILPGRFSLKPLADSQAPINLTRFHREFLSEFPSARYVTDFVSPLFERFVDLAECAYLFRDRNALGQAGRILTSLPLPEQFRLIGQYYEGLYVQGFGRGNLEQAARMFLPVAERAPERYRARALISLAANTLRRGDQKGGYYLYAEAARMNSLNGLFDPFVAVSVQKMMAIFSSRNGDHRRALSLFEDLYPQVHAFRGSNPQLYYDYLNSFAVELAEVGRLEEARNISEKVNASPLASSYREWRETREEIEVRARRTSRNTLAIHLQTCDGAKPLQRLDREALHGAKSAAPPATLAFLTPGSAYERNDYPQTEAIGTGHLGQPKPARVLNLLAWKKKMGKHPYEAADTRRQSGKMDGRDMLLRIMELAGSRERTDEELLRILQAIEGVLAEVKDRDRH